MKSSLESCNEKYKSAQLYAKGDNWADLNVNRVDKTHLRWLVTAKMGSVGFWSSRDALSLAFDLKEPVIGV